MNSLDEYSLEFRNGKAKANIIAIDYDFNQSLSLKHLCFLPADEGRKMVMAWRTEKGAKDFISYLDDERQEKARIVQVTIGDILDLFGDQKNKYAFKLCE